jgi:hypothetical protein
MWWTPLLRLQWTPTASHHPVTIDSVEVLEYQP